MYSIDHIKAIRRNLPKALRLPKFIAWIYVLLAPLRSIDVQFLAFRKEIRHEYKYSGTKYGLESLLNDKYDPILRRIYIIPTEKQRIVFLKTAFEIPEIFMRSAAETPNLFLKTAENFNQQLATSYEFTIFVHAAITFVPAEMIALVDIYRFAGLRPRIVTYGGGLPEVEIPIGEFEPGLIE